MRDIVDETPLETHPSPKEELMSGESTSNQGERPVVGDPGAASPSQSLAEIVERGNAELEVTVNPTHRKAVIRRVCEEAIRSIFIRLQEVGLEVETCGDICEVIASLRRQLGVTNYALGKHVEQVRLLRADKERLEAIDEARKK